MEKIEHPLLLVEFVNRLAAVIAAALGLHVANPAKIVPEYLVMCGFVVVFLTAVGLFLRSRLSVDAPGKVQIVLEDLISALYGMLKEDVGPKGARYFWLVSTIGGFILVGNMMGLIPGLEPATSNINVTLALALIVWFFYHFQGFREQGIGTYLKHFAMPPGIPIFLAPLMLPIEVISHLSRVMSLSLRLFGNIFGEHLVVLIIASIIPFLAPLPIMFLGLIVGPLQAFIFVKLTMIYLGGAVATEHGSHEIEAI